MALLCCASLSLEGEEIARGYIQNWLGGASIPEKSTQKIFATAAAIPKAGQERPAAAGRGEGLARKKNSRRLPAHRSPSPPSCVSRASSNPMRSCSTMPSKSSIDGTSACRGSGSSRVTR